MTDIYCLFNRARGSELISPDDLLQACTLLHQPALVPNAGMKLKQVSAEDQAFHTSIPSVASLSLVSWPPTCASSFLFLFAVLVSLFSFFCQFDSGVLVLQSDTHRPEEVYARILSLLQQQTCLTAMYLSHNLSLPLVIAKQHLLNAEQAQVVCRDQTLDALRFYRNRFPEFLLKSTASSQLGTVASASDRMQL